MIAILEDLLEAQTVDSAFTDDYRQTSATATGPTREVRIDRGSRRTRKR